MSGDHNQNQTDSGWRKRQIALDIKAKNARELGLDYEPNKTVIEMAREAGFEGGADLTWEGVICTEELEAFAALVRADEREACAKLLEDTADGAKKVDPKGFVWQAIQKSAELIRARGQA
jgi:hypothetical protein